MNGSCQNLNKQISGIWSNFPVAEEGICPIVQLEFYRDQVLGRQEPQIRYAIGSLLKRLQEKK